MKVYNGKLLALTVLGGGGASSENYLVAGPASCATSICTP